MPETFFILLCGGIMLAAAVPDPQMVTVHWLRLAGIIALSVGGLGGFFLIRSDARSVNSLMLEGIVLVLVLAQLGFAQSLKLTAQRLSAILTAIASVATAMVLCRAAALRSQSPELVRELVLAISLAGVAAMAGLALMDMLLGHAYLTASKMSMRPFERLNNLLAVVTAVRAASAVGGVLILQSRWPVQMLWGIFGLYIGTRWFVGLIMPAVFVYMTHDCIKRRATQSATGILYVAGLMVFIGELVALYLIRETGLPF